MDRRQIAAVLTLQRLGVEFNLETFTDRLIAQKAIYLAQTVGADLGYFYRWYLRGPYCPALTEDLFGAVADAAARDIQRSRWTLDELTTRRLDRLRAVVGKSGGDKVKVARRVELLASVHFLIAQKQVTHHGPKAIAEKLRAYGKQFDENDVKDATLALQELGALSSP